MLKPVFRWTRSRNSSASNEGRLLLCRPQGGLNDILCQIEKCCVYAERFGRSVIVDTGFETHPSFRDDFSKYFVSRQESLILSPVEYSVRFDGYSTFPNTVSGRVSQYQWCYDEALMAAVESSSRQVISFNFDKDYQEQLLVHHDFGGGDNRWGGVTGWGGVMGSVDALTRLRLQDSVLEILRQRIMQIGDEYTAIHIRNTDYKTDYKNWLALNASKIPEPIFIATDNQNTLEHCRKAFGSKQTFSFAEFPPTAGQPLHWLEASAAPSQRNLDAIIDLLMLSLSKHLIYFPLMPNREGSEYSGYTKLALRLHTSKSIVHQLMGFGPISGPSIGEGRLT